MLRHVVERRTGCGVEGPEAEGRSVSRLVGRRFVGSMDLQVRMPALGLCKRNMQEMLMHSMLAQGALREVRH